MPKGNKSNNETKPPERKDYWDKIAEDVSSGYGAVEVKKVTPEELLNEDQEPDDEKRGDTV